MFVAVDAPLVFSQTRSQLFGSQLSRETGSYLIHTSKSDGRSSLGHGLSLRSYIRQRIYCGVLIQRAKSVIHPQSS